MRASEVSIGEALSRIAETFGRLVVQHVQLLRTEVEVEARELGRQGQTLGRIIAKAAPFILAGLVVASIALGQLLGLAFEPLLGRAATPVATLLIGAVEVLVAGRWLKRQLATTALAHRPTTPPAETTTLEKSLSQDRTTHVANTVDRLPSGRAHIAVPPAST